MSDATSFHACPLESAPPLSQPIDSLSLDASKQSGILEAAVETNQPPLAPVDSRLPALDKDASPDSFVKTTDWMTIAHKLRQHNRDLIKKIVQKEQALSESHHQLQTQVGRSRSADILIAQQAEELKSYQERLNQQLEELELSHQTVQQQQSYAEELAKQLISTQERVAQLERECVLLQEDYDQQLCKLQESKQQTKELESRLRRQQRFTLEYKAALEQYRDSPIAFSNDQLAADCGRQSLTSQGSGDALVPSVPSIQPWSALGKENEDSLERDNVNLGETIADTEIKETHTPNSPNLSGIEKQPSLSSPAIADSSLAKKRKPIDLPNFLRQR